MLVEIQTGRPRPRHLRFHEAMAALAPGSRLERRDASRLFRLGMHVRTVVQGIRRVSLPPGRCYLVHQALACGAPYVAEFDVPFAVHGYRFGAYLNAAEAARRLIASEELRSLAVFSEWAKRAFAIHFGAEAAKKCRVVYPLSDSSARVGTAMRRYDFCFISTQFRIKAGPETVRAFSSARAANGGQGSLCVVTDLAEARRCLGELERFPGIEWRPANLSSTDVAGLLADSHCLVHPALAESFGVVVIEALAAGCAVIATDIASFPEMVADGENGFLVRAPVSTVVADVFIPAWGDMKAFSNFLERLDLSSLESDLALRMSMLLTDAERRAGFGAASSRLYRERFSLPAWRKAMHGLLVDAFPELSFAKTA